MNYDSLQWALDQRKKFTKSLNNLIILKDIRTMVYGENDGVVEPKITLSFKDHGSREILEIDLDKDLPVLRDHVIKMLTDHYKEVIDNVKIEIRQMVVADINKDLGKGKGEEK